ncbi:DNA-binding protein [Lojkania enalia]|uniref:DNA-binding protein n=1 Tax=Lojkania enalia TaxID=147567 RepID=A0A9P4KDR0_9PLEO|nr:DNA-binding protein [Didymosphaeria enalia]
MPETYNTTLTHFTNFLTAYTHTLLYLRTLYPRTSFTTSKFHNTPVHQSRHPAVCEWITDSIAAVRDQLLVGTVSRIAIVIFWYGDTTNNENQASGSVKILERYMLDVSQFPVIPKADRNTEIGYESTPSPPSLSLPSDSEGQRTDVSQKKKQRKGKQRLLDEGVHVDMSEQFRSALIGLTTRCSKLKPLPENCSFNIAIELKDEVDVDPPLGHPQPWIPVQHSLQKTGRKGGHMVGEEGHNEREAASRKEGQDLGGARVTPIRSVETGVFRFETWVEEGKAKFELEKALGNSFASSGG